MKSMTFEISCPKCGNELKLVAQSKSGGPTHRALFTRKTSPGKTCGLRWVLNMEMLLAAMTDEGEPSRCGTRLGFIDHERQGTEPCNDCINAKQHERVDSGRRLVKKPARAAT
jgi:transcription initiation factor IIE alpha subunit